MAIRPLPDQETLLKLLRYDPETGKLYWRERTPDMFDVAKPREICAAFNTRYAGQEAMTHTDTHGYNQGKLGRHVYLAHRAVWKIVTGEDPVEIDHLNGDRGDNRFANLRSTTHLENSRNKAIEARNTSGCIGVSFRSENSRWRARMKVNGRDISLGHFSSKEDAIRARKTAEKKFGFHPNHGRKATQ